MNRALAPERPTPPVLRTLGAVEFVDPALDGAVTDLLARPKLLGLLVYLTLTDSAALQQRDTLLGMFWPESDTARARASLRQAIYQLRRILGTNVITTRGDVVGIDSGAVSCDAVDFSLLIRGGDLAGAMERYRGDLLPGFFLDGCPGFEAWLERQRTQLRNAASAAARTLEEAAERSGNVADAVRWSRRALALAPADESCLRRLLDLLANSGDRAGALAEYEAFARRLREEYDLTPSDATRAVVARLGRPGASSADPHRVLVAVFENRTGVASLDSFGSLIADAVAQSVSRVDGVQVMPLTAALVLASSRSAAAGPLTDAEWMHLLAQETDAGTVVSGAYYAAGDELVVQGWIGDACSKAIRSALGPARARITSPMTALERLQDEAATSIALQLETRISHMRAAAHPPTFSAHAAYVEGLMRFVAGDWRGALHHFERSTTNDPDYPLPLIVSGIARWNLGELAAARAAASQARPLVARAAPFDRALLDMVDAWLDGDWDAAYAAVQRQAELAPGSIPSFQVAEEARRRNRPREAVRVLRSLDPTRGELRGWIFYWVVLTQALHMLHEHTAELEAARSARALFPGSAMALRLELHARAAMGDVDGVHACINESLTSPARQEPRAGALMREAAHELRAHGHDSATADTLLTESLKWYRELPADERARPAVQRAIARAHYDAGDLAAAERMFTALAGDTVEVANCGAAHHPHLQAHLDHGYLGAIAARNGDEAGVARIEPILSRAEKEHRFGSTYYWRAVIAAVRGDTTGAARLLRRAFADGMPYEPFIHRDPHFASIRDHPGFASVLAPQG